MELNKNLLNTFFEFNPLSELRKLLINKTGVEKNYYSLYEILTILKNIIKREELFDHTNPAIVICSKELEKALNCKACHVSELRDLVMSQITKIPEKALRKKYAPQIHNCKETQTDIHSSNLNPEVPRDCQPQSQQQAKTRIKTANFSTTIWTDRNTKFTLTPELLKVIHLVPGTDPLQTIFSYEEVTLLLSKYILLRKDKIFDSRNILLALIADDPLRDALKVKSFHRSQFKHLLGRQLTPVNSDCSPDLAKVIKNTIRLDIMVTEKHTPIDSVSADTKRQPLPKTSISTGHCYATSTKAHSLIDNPPDISSAGKKLKSELGETK